MGNYRKDVERDEQVMACMSILEGTAHGEQAIKDGRVMSHRDAKDQLSKWMK